MEWKPSKSLFHVCSHIVLEPEDAFRHCCDAAGVQLKPEQPEEAGGEAGRCREGPGVAGGSGQQQAPAPAAEAACEQIRPDPGQQAVGEPSARLPQQAAAGVAPADALTTPATASPLASPDKKRKQKGLLREGVRRSARGVEAAQRAEQAKQMEEDAALALQQLCQGITPCALCPACGQPIPPGAMAGAPMKGPDCKKVPEKQQRLQEGMVPLPVCQPAPSLEAPQAEPGPVSQRPPQATSSQPVSALRLQQGVGVTDVGRQQGEASQQAGGGVVTPGKGKNRWSKKRRREEASRPASPASALVVGTHPAPSTQAVLQQPSPEQPQGKGGEVQQTPGGKKRRHGRRSSMAGPSPSQLQQEQPAQQHQEQQQATQLEGVAESEGRQRGQEEPAAGTCCRNLPPAQQRPSWCGNEQAQQAAVAAVFADWGCGRQGADGYPHAGMPALVARLRDPAYTAPQEWSVPEAIHLCLLAHRPDYFRAHTGQEMEGRKGPKLLAAYLRRDFDSDVSEVLLRYRGRVAVAACGGPGASAWDVATQLRRDFPQHWQGFFQRVPPQLMRDGDAGCGGCSGGPSSGAQQGLPAQQEQQQQQEGAAADGAVPAPAAPQSPDNSAGGSQPQQPPPSTGTSMLLGSRSLGDVSAALKYVSTFLADLGE